MCFLSTDFGLLPRPLGTALVSVPNDNRYI
jgi:hypothetical protein